MNGPLTLTYTPHHAGTKQKFLLSVLNMSESREAGPMVDQWGNFVPN